MTKLPDAERLCADLLKPLKPMVGPKTAMIGIYTGGAWLAERLHARLGIAAPLGLMDIAFYRDDYHAQGLHHDPKRTKIPFDVNGGGRQLPICAQHCGARVEVPSGMRLRLKRDAAGNLALALEPEHAA